jgi:hypothetical protein
VYVLSHLVDAVKPGGIALDLQVIRPNPRVEVAGSVLCEIEGAIFREADAAAAAIDGLISAGRLVEEAVDDHDVLEHYVNGAELVDDYEDSAQRLPEAFLPRLRTIERPCVVRERCRLRQLRVRSSPNPSSPLGHDSRA